MAATHNDKLLLGYWAMPLRAQPARYILELAGYPYEEKQYTPQTAGEWFGKEKQSLGFDFPNLPYLINGATKLTESQNIVNYLVELTKQPKLQGNGQTKYLIDNVRFVCDELTTKIFQASKLSGEEGTKNLEANVLPKITLLQKNLAKKLNFYNNEVTLADIYAYTALSLFKHTQPVAYKPFAESFDGFLANFEAIPSIKAYQASARYPRLPPVPAAS